ncbi:hypothetical protein [Bradyrhizobium sp. 2TAF24]|uniref:hypothetical protein n=1 Tax=Bradyrhizobium sp. 2TAF24 TaxID=3233011 RepID=UPI003F8FAB4A
MPDPSAPLHRPAPRRLLFRLVRALLVTGAAFAVLTLAWLAFEDAITVDLQAGEPVITARTPASGACHLRSRPATLDLRPTGFLDNI